MSPTAESTADGTADGVPPDYDQLTYEELVALLEALIERMASGSIGIEEATALYEQANHVHALAADRLEQVRTRVERLAPGLAHGGPAPAP